MSMLKRFTAALLCSALAFATTALASDPTVYLPFNGDGVNVLKALCGNDATVRTGKGSTLVDGLGNVTLCNGEGATSGSGAVQVPVGQHLAIEHGLDASKSWYLALRFRVPSSSSGYVAFYSLNNNGDAALFKANGGTGIGSNSWGKKYGGSLTYDKWQTLVVVGKVNDGNSVEVFLDGASINTGSNTAWYDLSGKSYIYVAADDSGEDAPIQFDWILVGQGGYADYEECYQNMIDGEYDDDEGILLKSSTVKVGTVSPDYGKMTTATVGAEYTFSVLQDEALDGNGVLYRCAGWTFVDKDGNETSGSELTKTITYGGGLCILTWNWIPVLTWETGSYDAGTWTPNPNNILAGKSAAFTGGKYDGDSSGKCNNTATILTDGSVVASRFYDADFGIKDSGSTLTWTWDDAKNISKVQLFTWWGDGGRDGIAVSKVEAMVGGAWVDVGAPSVSFGVGNSSSTSGRAKAVLTADDGLLVAGATALRLTFGAQDNNGAGYCEIEAEELLADNLIAITSSVGGIGVPDPAYGAKLDVEVGNSYTFTMTTPSVDDRFNALQYTCTGWTLTDPDGNVTSGDELTKTIDFNGGRYRLIWNWSMTSTGKKPGLYQKVYSGAFVTTGDPAAEDDHAVVPGAMFACQPAASAASGQNASLTYTHKGATYTLGANQTAAYAGYMYMVGGETYTFVKNFDDGGLVIVDGNTLINNNNYKDTIYGSFTPPETGYYPVEFRLGQGTGGIGPVEAPFTTVNAGLLWSTNETSVTTANIGNWHKLVNTEDDVYLFTTLPGVTVASSAAEFGTVSPNYGLHTDLDEGETYTFSVTESEVADAFSGDTYVCTGWKLVDPEGVETTGDGLSKEIAFAGGNYVLTWQWTKKEIQLIDADFLHKVTFTVGAGYTGGALEYFPVLVRLSADIEGMDMTDFAADGSDIRFADANGNMIPHEIDTWNPDGESLIWVRLPSMQTGATFKMYYGPRGTSPAAMPSTSVWPTYAGVWHMNEASGTVHDSTINGLDAAVCGSAAKDAQSIGVTEGTPFGGTMRRNGDGVNTKVKGADSSYLLVASDKLVATGIGKDATISGWGKLVGNQKDGYPRFYSAKDKYDETTDTGPQMEFQSASVTGYTLTGGNKTGLNVSCPDISQNWLYFTHAFANAGKVSVYNNGAVVNNEAGLAAIVNWKKGLAFGSNVSGNEWAVCGWFDEFRLSAMVRSADWVAAEYLTMTDATLLSASHELTASFAIKTHPVEYDATTGKWTLPVEVLRGSGNILCKIEDVNGSKIAMTSLTGVGPGSYAIELSGMAADTGYTVKITGVNGSEVTEYDAGAFYHGAISITAGDDVSFDDKRNGTFTVSRGTSAAATAYDLVVGYTVGGTAEAGVDFKPLSGTVTIPAGESSVTLEVAPVYHSGYEGDRALTLTLDAGTYAINGSAASATISCVQAGNAWLVASDGKSMNDGTGWTLNCSISDGKITVGTVKTASTTSTEVDLSRGFIEGDYEITVIGDNAFKGNTTITAVYLPETLVKIGNAAFNSCSGLVKVEPFLPEGVTSIGYQCFTGCSKLEGCLAIGTTGACTLVDNGQWSTQFQGTKIQELVLGDGITRIPQSCFQNCTSLTNVTLGANLTYVGITAFSGCSNLAKVEPFLPASVTKVEWQAFTGCSKLKGKLVVGMGESFEFGDNTKWSTTFQSTAIEEVVLGDAVTKIPQYCFGSCGSLTNVTLGANLERIEPNAFISCGALTTITPFLPDSVTYIGNNAFQACSKLGGTLTLGKNEGLTFGLNDKWTCTFENAIFDKIVFGPGVTNIGNAVFQNTKAVKEVTFLGDKPEWHSAAFNNWTTYQSRWLVPSKQIGWAAFLADPAALTTKDAMGETEADKYTYVDANVMLGYTATAPAKQWVAAYDLGGDAISLNILGSYNGATVEYGAPYPAYGLIEDTEGESVVCTVPEFAINGNSRYRCVGYTLEDLDPISPSATIEGGTLSYTFNPSKASAYRLTWLWEGPVAYRPTVTQPLATHGSITVNTAADGEGFYATDSMISMTAVPAVGATFVCWIGDVTDEQRYDATIEIPADSERKVTAYFAKDWVYDSSAKTITDGYWTLNVESGGGNTLKIKGINACLMDGFDLLDLRKSVEGGDYVITVINSNGSGNPVFYNNTTLREVFLPDTLTYIGWNAFRGCTALEKVEPFLPDSVTGLGQYAFAGCAKLACDLRLGYNEGTITFDNQNGNAFTFQNSGITSVDLGPAVSAIPSYVFDTCKSLKSVKLPDNLTSLGWFTFSTCTALETVTPFLPETLTGFGAGVFYNCTSLKGDLRLIINSENYALSASGSNGAFANCAIDSAVFGDNIVSFPAAFCSGCKQLKSVVLPANLKTISNDVFANTTSLKTVTPFLPATVSSIGAAAFYKSAVETPLVLSCPDLKAIGESGNYGAFYGTMIPSIDMRGSGLTGVARAAFCSDTALKTVYLAEGVKSLSVDAFTGCTNLTAVYWQAMPDTPVLTDYMFNRTALETVHYFPADDKNGWFKFIEENCAAVALTPEEREAAAAKFPGQNKPKGKFKFNFAHEQQEYYGTWSTKSGTMIMLR